MPHAAKDDPNQNKLPVEVPEQTLTPEEVKKLVEANEQWATNRVAEPPRLRDECRTLAEKNSTVSSIGETGYLDRLKKESIKEYTPRTQNLQAKLLGDPVPYPELDHLELDAPTTPSVPETEAPKPFVTESMHVYHFQDQKGMSYLATLLSRPGQPIPAVELAAPTLGERTEEDGDSGDDGDWPEDENDSPRKVGREDIGHVSLGPDSPIQQTDARYRQELQQEALALAEEIKEKRKCGLDPAKELCDLAQIKETLKSSTFCGRSKNFPDSAEKARQSVSKAIRGALLVIRSVIPAAATHIQSNLKLGRQLVYLDTSEKISLVRAGKVWCLSMAD